MSAAIVTPNTAGRRKRRTRSQAQNERSKRRKVESSEEGKSLVGACFDKRFIGYGTWTATIDAYDSNTKKYTCRYVDGYLEFHTREKLEKYGLFRPEEGEVVEPNTNPDEHPALRPKKSKTNGTLAAATTEKTQHTGSAEAVSTPLSGARRNNEILLSDDDDDEADDTIELVGRSSSNTAIDTVDLTGDENLPSENNATSVISDLVFGTATNGGTLPEAGIPDGATLSTPTSSSQATYFASASEARGQKKRAVPAENNHSSTKKKQKKVAKNDNAVDVKPEPVAFGMADIPPDVVELSEKDFYGPVEWGKLQKARHLESTTSTVTSDENASASTTSTAAEGVDDDIVFIGSTDNVSTYDLPHSRKDCPVEKYQPHFVTKRWDSHDKDTPAQKRKRRAQNKKICPKCYCVICEIPAKNCKSWAIGSKPHCNAELGGFDDAYWQRQKIISSNVLLRNAKEIATVATAIISSEASTIKGLFERYRRGKEVYRYNSSDDDEYGFFGFAYNSPEFSHMSHDFDLVASYCNEKLQNTGRFLDNHLTTERVSCLPMAIGTLDALTEQLGRNSWCPPDAEVSSVGDKWDPGAKKKYEGLVVKLGAQWLRLINPIVLGHQPPAKSYIGYCPALKKEMELCWSTNKCPDHRLSEAGLKEFFKGRTSKRLQCPYPRCKSVVGKYDYKYRKEESDAVDYRAVPVKQSLLATLKLRLKNLLNVAKTDSMRDMLQGLLYDGKVSSDVRAGDFQPYRASTVSDTIPNFFALVALEQGRIEYAIQQILSSRNMSMLPVMRAIKSDIYSEFSKHIHRWDLLNTCILGTDIDSDIVDILLDRVLSPYAPRSYITPSQQEVGTYIVAMRCFFGKMKDCNDCTDADTVINLVDEDENSSTGANTVGRHVRFGRGNSHSQEHEVVEVVANIKGSTIGLDIKAGPFGRIYVVGKETTGASKTGQGDDVERNKIVGGDLVVSVNGKYLAKISYDGGPISKSEEGSKCSSALFEARARTKSCSSPLRVIVERPSYTTTIKRGVASFKTIFCRQFFGQKFAFKYGKKILDSYNDRLKAEEVVLKTMQQGSNANIIQMLLLSNGKAALTALRGENICFLEEMMFANAARFIMTSECPKRLAKQYARDFGYVYTAHFDSVEDNKYAPVAHRAYRFLYWCSKYYNVVTDFGKAFLGHLCSLSDLIRHAFPMMREYNFNHIGYIRFDIDVPKAKLPSEKKVWRELNKFYLEKFDINVIQILLENSEMLTPECICLFYQLRSYEIYCKNSEIKWCTDSFKEQWVGKIVSTYKNFSLSKCRDFDKLWEVLPLFLKSDPKMQFLNFCLQFIRIFDKSVYFKDGCESHLSTFAEVSELKKFAKTLDDNFVKDNLSKMMEHLLRKLKHERNHYSEEEWLRDNSEKIYDAQIRSIVKVLHFMELEYKMQVPQYIRSLMAAPYDVERIPGYPTSREKEISRPAQYGNSTYLYKYYTTQKARPYTILKLKFVASVLKNEFGQYTSKQQNVILNEFAPFFNALMRNVSVKKMLPHTWSIICCARKRRNVWLKAIGEDIEQYHVQQYLEKLKLRRLKTSCSPIFGAIKANKISSWREKCAYKVTILVQRNSATRMGISFASIHCKTKSPTSKKRMFALSVDEILDEFMIRKVNNQDIFGYHPDLGKSVFKVENRQVKVGDILYKIGGIKVLGCDAKRVRAALKTLITSKNKHNYNGVLRSKLECVFLRKFEDTESFLW